MQNPSIVTLELLQHQAWVRRLAGVLVADPAAADDVVQETWRQVLERPPGRSPRHPRAWLATLVRTSARRRARGELRRRRREELAARPEAESAPEDLASRARIQRDLVDAILALGEETRDTVLARYFDDLPPREIARRQGVPVETVKSRLKRGVEKLRARLDAEYGDRGSWCLALAGALRVPSAPAAAGGLAALLWATLVALPLVLLVAWSLHSARDVDPELQLAVAAPSASGNLAPVPRSVVEEAEADRVRRAIPTVATGPEVRVVSSTGDPSPDARLRYYGVESREIGELLTDEAGAGRLPAAGVYLIAVEPTSGAGRAELLTIGDDGVRLELPPQGSLEVRFVDAGGRAVPGVEARLVHPEAGPGFGFGDQDPETASGGVRRAPWVEFLEATLERGGVTTSPGPFAVRWERLRNLGLRGSVSSLDRALHQAWPGVARSRTSDAEGRMRWDGLPPSPAWEIQVTSPHHLPMPEVVRGVDELPDGGVRMSGGPTPTNVSAPIPIRAGEITGRELALSSEASVVGALDGREHGWIETPILELIHVATIARGTHQHEREASVQVTPSGAFSFASLRPGSKIVRARWLDESGRLRVVHRAFELAPAERRDLGELAPLAGRELDVRILLHDPAGASLDPDLLRRTSRNGRGRLGLLFRDADGSRRARGYEGLDPWPGETLRMTGLPAGDEIEVYLSLPPVEAASGFRLETRNLQRTVAFPANGVLELAFVLRPIARVTLCFTSDEDAGYPHGIWFAGAEPRGRRNATIRPDATAEAELFAGRYEVFTEMRTDEVPGQFFRGEVDVTGDTELEFTLTPAAGLRGRVSPGSYVSLARGARVPSPREGWSPPWSANVDDDGRFAIGGLPPNTSLVLRVAREYHLVVTGAAGTVRELELPSIR